MPETGSGAHGSAVAAKALADQVTRLTSRSHIGILIQALNSGWNVLPVWRVSPRSEMFFVPVSIRPFSPPFVACL